MFEIYFVIGLFFAGKNLPWEEMIARAKGKEDASHIMLISWGLMLLGYALLWPAALGYGKWKKNNER